MINLDEVLTFSEAAEKWGLADGKTIRKAVERNRFEAHEIKKSGNVWLTTYDAMYRVFGEPRNEAITLSYYDIFSEEEIIKGVHKFLETSQKAIEDGKLIRVIENKDEPDKVLFIIKTKEELNSWKRRFQYYFQDNK